MPEHRSRRNVALAIAATIDGRPHYQIAAAAAINPSTFAGFITGRVDPRPEQRAAVAAALGQPERDLFEAVDSDA